MNRLFLLAASMVTATFVASPASAITDTIFKYTQTRNGYFGISPMAMAPDGTGAADDFSITWSDGLTSASNNCFNTGVNLPQGATITALRVYLQSAGTSDVFVRLVYSELAGNSGDLVSQTIANDTATRVGATIVVPDSMPQRVVDNVNIVYGLGVCVGPGDVFYGARVNYTYTNAGD